MWIYLSSPEVGELEECSLELWNVGVLPSGRCDLLWSLANEVTAVAVTCDKILPSKKSALV